MVSVPNIFGVCGISNLVTLKKYPYKKTVYSLDIELASKTGASFSSRKNPNSQSLQLAIYVS